MRVAAVADTHGVLMVMPPCDVCVIAGDFMPATDHSPDFQENWLCTEFNWWLRKIPAKKIIGIAGNHDQLFENFPGRVPDLPWTYLQDSGTEFEGYKIWGTPWQPYFFGWAFNGFPHELKKMWAKIPDDTDILVVHGPPYYLGDAVQERDGGGFTVRHAGCPFLRERIKEIKPRLVICGHIHPGYGVYVMGDTVIANVCVVNEKYELTNQPTVFDVNDGRVCQLMPSRES